MIKIKKR